MRSLTLVLLGVLVILYCSPTTVEEKGKPQTLTRSGDLTKAPVPLSIVMTSTGKISSGLTKTLADSFSYPIKQWLPSSFYSGCPDYIDLNLTTIFANGRWMIIKTHVDTITYDTAIADTSKPKTTAKLLADSTKDSTQWWDTIVVKSDTIYEERYQTLWTGNKAVRFDGLPISLANFDTLHIPRGTLYAVFVEASPVAKIKGSVTGLFTFGKQGDSTISRVKTYYTKAAYFWDAQANTGGSGDPAVFENGPAEEASITILQIDTSVHDAKGGQNPYLRIETACTTTVADSANLTILFDISRVMTFYDGDTINKNQAPSGGPYDKAYFSAHGSFCGASKNTSIAAVFPGEVGTVEGYKVEYTWSQTDPAFDADSAGPYLQNDTTYGGLGWFTIIYDPAGNVLSGKMFQDNASFCPTGTITYFNAAEQRFDLGLNPAVFHINGFTRGTAIGNSCFGTVFSPKWSIPNAQSSNARSGEIKFTLQLIQN